MQQNNLRGWFEHNWTTESTVPLCKLWLALVGSETSRLQRISLVTPYKPRGAILFFFSVETDKGGVVPNVLISMPTSPHTHWALSMRDSDLIIPAKHLEPLGLDCCLILNVQQRTFFRRKMLQNLFWKESKNLHTEASISAIQQFAKFLWQTPVFSILSCVFLLFHFCPCSWLEYLCSEFPFHQGSL